MYRSQSIYKSWWWSHSEQLANTVLTCWVQSLCKSYNSVHWTCAAVFLYILPSFHLRYNFITAWWVILSRWACYNNPLQKSQPNSFPHMVAFCGCMLAQHHTAVYSLRHHFDVSQREVKVTLVSSFQKFMFQTIYNCFKRKFTQLFPSQNNLQSL